LSFGWQILYSFNEFLAKLLQERHLSSCKFILHSLIDSSTTEITETQRRIRMEVVETLGAESADQRVMPQISTTTCILEREAIERCLLKTFML